MSHPTFPLTLHWTGTTTDEVVNKDSVAKAHGKADLRLSAGAGEGASAARWNPEDLLGASLAQCHMLTFLALAKKVKLDVRAYDDDVLVELVTEDRLTRVGKITLAPTITIAEGTDPDKTRTMFEKAHKYCFIANSVNAEVVMEPTVVVG